MGLFQKNKNAFKARKTTDSQAIRTQLLNTLNDMSASWDGVATELTNLTAEIKRMDYDSDKRDDK